MERGYETFTGVIAGFAAQLGARRADVRELAARTGGPLRIVVRGRAGVGLSTTVAALERALPGDALVLVERAAGTPGAPGTDVDVVVAAGDLKPEDREALAGPAALLLLNKADLTDAGLADRYRAETGVLTLPLSAHLAHVEVDGDMLAALRMLLADPADPSSVDRFATAAHAVPAELRGRLLRELDLQPMTRLLEALRRDRSLGTAELTALARGLSGIDAAVAAIQAALAQARYRRARAAIDELAALAVTGPCAGEIGDFLGSDACVLAVMRCAVDAATAAGLVVAGGAAPADHHRRALHWQRFAAGPVVPEFAAMGTDICRGSLRLWKSAGGRV